MMSKRVAIKYIVCNSLPNRKVLCSSPHSCRDSIAISVTFEAQFELGVVTRGIIVLLVFIVTCLTKKGTDGL